VVGVLPWHIIIYVKENAPMKRKRWKPSNISEPIEMRSHDLEFQDTAGEWHHFTVIATARRIVFGGVTNTGFIESGYLLREGFGIDECLQALVEDLEVFYNDGPDYVSGIVFNDRM